MAIFQVDPAEIAEVSCMPVPEHTTVFDESEFLWLVAHSYSLVLAEKRDIVRYVPSYSQGAVDELFRIFREEQSKFDALKAKALRARLRVVRRT